ncbi:YidH family protein [Gordonia crocea]|uniref:DUF202 domain-containing protein n=1 Tax=Gordonia crocea TaxID=589162 RepID=A0A7I9V125_9ACTN|nr:DUF202 domain-containing protein [Gordonia crocea]GED98886.1 hypothetical protein nbrc107697_29250 [Gordonia crocea]
MTDPTPTGPERPDANTQLAVVRTNLALERTMMAWIRTSTSLIAFGFTIFQFFEYRRAEHHETIASPQVVGMIMIVVGLVALILAWIQHERQRRALRTYDSVLASSLAGLMAALITLFGLVALVIVVWRV